MGDLTETSALPLSLPFLVEHAYQTMDLWANDTALLEDKQFNVSAGC
jgi:hypothetical protein